MKQSISAWILPLALVSCVASPQPVTVKREVQISIFSGLPDPVFTLTASEAADVQRWLMPADSESTGQTPEALLPEKLGYRGIVLTDYDAEGRVLARTEIVGRSVLSRQSGQPARLTTSREDAERKLVDLAFSKAVISAELHRDIHETIAQRSN
jgi:hypothetical protein